MIAITTSHLQGGLVPDKTHTIPEGSAKEYGVSKAVLFLLKQDGNRSVTLRTEKYSIHYKFSDGPLHNFK